MRSMSRFFKKECAEHPYRFIIGFFVIFISWFAFLEWLNLPIVWHIHCRLDQYIPFVKYAVIPYCIWFLWMTQAMFHMVLREDAQTRWRTLAPLFSGLLLILLFCMLVPNGISLRPAEIAGNDLCAVAVRIIEGTDNPNNVCPSMHVYSTIFLDFAVHRAKGYRHRFVRPLARVMDIMICCSTMLLKQHSVIDVTCALAFAIVMDLSAEYLMARSEAREVARQRA